jgi:hypothetical protein
MQAFYPDRFDREVGCTEAEWLMWLPAAIGDCAWSLSNNQATVVIDEGSLLLQWILMPPRQIALVRLPRLGVQFVFEGLSEPRRFAFMKRFDLYMQRGGG